MKIKTSEATPMQIDWLVAKCECEPSGNYIFDGVLYPHLLTRYTIDWAQGGPIIEWEKIALIPPNERIDEWEAVHPERMHDEQYGPTPLIAAMRCYVASKLGDEVAVPKEMI